MMDQLAVSPLMLGLIGGMFLLLMVFAGLILNLQYGPRARLRRRMEAVTGVSLTGGRKGAAQGKAQPGGGRKKAIQTKLKELEQQRKQQKAVSLKQRLIQAGLQVSPRGFVLIGLAFGAFSAVVYYLMGYNPIGIPLVLVAMGLGFPRLVLKKLIKRRQKKFTANFADAIDVIVRGIRSGLPVGECMSIIGREFDDPVGPEFQLLIEGQKLGMTLSDVLDRALTRMPTNEVKFFAIVLVIQQQTGGNLADTLSNLSNVLRERKKLKDKIKSLSSEAKASAMIIGSLPIVMTLLLFLVKREYITTLFTDPVGQIMILIGLGWMGTGVLIMNQMVNFEA
ncbi:type II secretion system F family protein [Roseospirillum parvum]|uniref:Tight adherence protein B n=1 Tax=Roseospirillum parvum TaxID=83401 RepID=A0A1G8C0B9_9PROT|nr:type II secretion system F family protein [Roseospirillum parvum]SDH38927.1 tight adherence protein B [Roseospirillum parvum]